MIRLCASMIVLPGLLCVSMPTLAAEQKLPQGAVACLSSDQSGPIFAMAISADGKALASAGYDGAIRIWDLKIGKELRAIPGRRGNTRSIAFSPDGKLVAAAGAEKSARIWDAHTGKLVRELSADLESIASVAFSLDGKTVACGGGFLQHVILLFDLANGNVRRSMTLTGDAREKAWSVVRALAFSTDGKLLAAANGNNTVSVCDVKAGKEVLHFDGHEEGVFSVAWAPDGKTLLTAGGDNTLRLWKIPTGERIREFHGHEDWVTAAAFSPTGRLIVSSSYDRTVRLWEAATAKEIRQFTGHSDRIRCAAFAPDGKTAITGGLDALIFVWDVAGPPGNALGDCHKLMQLVQIKSATPAEFDMVQAMHKWWSAGVPGPGPMHLFIHEHITPGSWR
jgi:WD40 repeat protein